jgi:dihydroxyacetone kinase-like protein
MSEYGLRVERSLVGTYATSLDMQGLSITLAFLTDEELSLWDSPVATAALRWRC